MSYELLALKFCQSNCWALVSTSSLGYILFHLLLGFWKRQSLRKRLSEKHQQLEKARAAFCDRVTKEPPPTEQHINLLPLDVLRLLRTGQMTPTDALRLYQRRTMELLSFNCVTDIIEEAEDTACRLPTGDPLSPIHGLPVSIKENICIKGYDAACGVVQFIVRPSVEDSNLIKVLRHSGAVPFVMTTMSPTGLCMDSSTEIYGKQRNPLDLRRITGGSTGGEAILLARGGSPLGFGTDIAGSVRLPAAWCGICALKPTSRRLTTVGVNSVCKYGTVHLRPVVGPMASRVDLLTDSMRALLCPFMFNLDPRVVPLPFREDIYASKKPLRIGYYARFESKYCLLPVPAVDVAVRRAKAILEAKGHEVVTFDLPDPDKCFQLVSTAIFADGGAYVCRVTQGDPTNSRFELTRRFLSLPRFLRRLLGSLATFCYSGILGMTIATSVGCENTAETAKLLQSIREYELQFDKAWRKAGIDALMGPAVPFPAPLDATPDMMLAGFMPYLSMYNMLDCPAGVVPVTRVTASDVEAASVAETEFRKRKDWSNAKLAHLQSGTEGLPVAVQVVGQYLCEETVLRVISDIEQGVESPEHKNDGTQ